MKKFLIIILTFTLLFIFGINSYALDDTYEIWNAVDDTTMDYLEELGIDELNFKELFEVSPLRVIKFIFTLAFNKTSSLSGKIIIIFIVLILSSIASYFLRQSNNFDNVIDYICIIVILSFVMEPVGQLLADAASGIKNSTAFIHVYLPVMTGIIIASKSPTLAITYNSFSITLYIIKLYVNIDKYLDSKYLI